MKDVVNRIAEDRKQLAAELSPTKAEETKTPRRKVRNGSATPQLSREIQNSITYRVDHSKMVLAVIDI